jgi:hypothetical protein
MVSANAQWLNYPQPRTPLTRDGKPNLSAKAPRARDGKPDLSGVWQIEPPPAGDAKVLTQPVTIKFTELLIPNSDVLKSFCAEGERDQGHMLPPNK